MVQQWSTQPKVVQQWSTQVKFVQQRLRRDVRCDENYVQYAGVYCLRAQVWLGLD